MSRIGFIKNTQFKSKIQLIYYVMKTTFLKLFDKLNYTQPGWG